MIRNYGLFYHNFDPYILGKFLKGKSTGFTQTGGIGSIRDRRGKSIIQKSGAAQFGIRDLTPQPPSLQGKGEKEVRSVFKQN
jgi:hypothetical protein